MHLRPQRRQGFVQVDTIHARDHHAETGVNQIRGTVRSSYSIRLAHEMADLTDIDTAESSKPKRLYINHNHFL